MAQLTTGNRYDPVPYGAVFRGGWLSTDQGVPPIMLAATMCCRECIGLEDVIGCAVPGALAKGGESLAYCWVEADETQLRGGIAACCSPSLGERPTYKRSTGGVIPANRVHSFQIGVPALIVLYRNPERSFISDPAVASEPWPSDKHPHLASHGLSRLAFSFRARTRGF